MSTAIELRRVAASDAPAIAALLDELGYPTSVEAVRERLARLIAEPSSELLVAAAGGVAVGLAMLHVMRTIEHDHPVGVLSALVVSARVRRLRVGMRLVAAVEERARAQGCRRVVVTTAERRRDAHAFYRSIGYVQTGRRFARELER